MWGGVSGRHGVAMAGAELLGLSAIVVAQPIFDAMQRSTYAFAAAGVQGFDVVLLTATLLLVPPAVMLAVELVAGLPSRSLRGWVHLGWVALLVSLFCWQAVKQANATSHLLYVAIPAAGFVGAAALYLRFEALRSLLRILALSAPVIAALFLFTPPIRSFTLASNPDVPGPRIDSRTPVVLIVFDELPLATLLNARGRIDAKRFPHFAALARDSDWFRNALTVADTTEEAVPAIMTGDFPKPNGVATYSDHPRNLFTLLGSSYETNISESATSLCPPQLCTRRGSLSNRLSFVTRVGVETADSFPFDLATRIARKLEGGPPGRVVLGEAPGQVEGFLEGIRASTGGSLDVLHVELPHTPYQYMPSGRRYRTSPYLLGVFGNEWPASPGYAIQGLQRLILQLQYTDRVLGQIVARLRQSGLYRRALVAVVADHGESLIPGTERRLVRPATAGWVLPVPLFVKKPNQRHGRTISRPVRTIDLLPTIADVLGVRIPWKVDGRSLLGPPSTRGANTYLSNGEDIVHVSPSKVRREFSSALAVRNGLFGSGDIFTMGASRRELRAELRGARRLQIPLDDLNVSTYYDPSSDPVPSLIYGPILDPPARVPERLIVTLNGQVAAVAESLDDGTSFTTLISPSAFRPGANRLRIYAP